jgi:hypothetical protein
MTCSLTSAMCVTSAHRRPKAERSAQAPSGSSGIIDKWPSRGLPSDWHRTPLWRTRLMFTFVLVASNWAIQPSAPLRGRYRRPWCCIAHHYRRMSTTPRAIGTHADGGASSTESRKAQGVFGDLPCRAVRFRVHHSRVGNKHRVHFYCDPRASVQQKRSKRSLASRWV